MLKLTDAEHASLADRLYRAIRSGMGIDPPSGTVDYSLEDAYRVRRKLVDRLIADGARPCGHKIGFTSEAMQKMYGMTGPDFGILLDTMILKGREPVRVSHLSNTRAEPELAFELARPLTGPGVTIAEALAATARVWAAVEIIDSRVGAMRAKSNDSIADNAGAGWVVLGRTPIDPTSLDLAAIPVAMEAGGTVQSAISGDIMGHPAAPLAWLANKLPDLGCVGDELRAGDIVITGAPVRSVEVRAGDYLTATFGELGTIEILFT